jgi:uncharacterized protein DUF5753/uncharacterized protein DUF397
VTRNRPWGHLKKGQKQRTYGWFERWADIDAGATTLRSYEPLVVPGLLQTDDYARVILSKRPGGDQVSVRDSKDPAGPRLAFAPDAWTAFADRVKTGL